MTLSLSVLTPGTSDFDIAVEQVAGLRIAVFRAWPYLYDGTFEFERHYITKLAKAKRALIVVARDGSSIVGVSTGMPMADEHEELIEPLRTHGYDPAEVFYGAETVMLPEYRGRGLYREFLSRRREHAQKLGGFKWEGFYGVIRPQDHPLRDAAVVPVEPMWERFGFRRAEGVVCAFSWKDIDEEKASEKPMQFWLREL